MDQMIEFARNHWILFSALGLTVYLLLHDLFETLMRKYATLSPVRAVELMNTADVTVIDVREPAEYIGSHIENSINVPSTKFDQRIHELESYKNGPVLVSCESGTRSPKVCNRLIKEGFQNVYLLKGGIQAWEDLHLPIRRSKPKHRK
ncbi:MAG: rhodanese-like domain-containing protein [Methylococcaceae bacterium]|nr:rhodanese-like domain-containing protein [Methylococcaceae bacterium]MCI0668668.1 rhodanese-like domain-containing protein [Methylococcaceae bacterium]MCI0734443.1 rhodanese-like domain-containing protein [Methylococcaceae bacterium]